MILVYNCVTEPEAALQYEKNLIKKIEDGIFINGKEVRTGPPPSYEKLIKTVGRYVRKNINVLK